MRGFLTACPPREWMVEEVEAAIQEACSRVHHLVSRGADALPDRNLETGGPSGPGMGHPASDEAAARLDALSAVESTRS